MRLVLIYHWGNFEASGTEVLPVEYESPEKAIVDFEAALADTASHKFGDFEFAGHPFSAYIHSRKEDGEFYLPEILTVDEWFNQYGAQA